MYRLGGFGLGFGFGFANPTLTHYQESGNDSGSGSERGVNRPNGIRNKPNGSTPLNLNINSYGALAAIGHESGKIGISSSSSSSSRPIVTSSPHFTLRWFRFACFDVSRTMDFWVGVMKMHLDRQIDTGAKIRTGCQYPGDKVGLRFEYETYAKNPPNRIHPLTGLPIYPSTPTSPISIVVYVDSVDDYITRCREAGFVVWIEAVTISEEPIIRSGVILDPCGLKVRLLESEIYELNKMRTRGRLAYVTIPIKEYGTVEKCMKFYEETFPSRSSSFASSEGQLSKNQEPRSMSRVTTWDSVPPNKGTGFRLIDMERFVEELTTYVWLANGSRKKHTAVCLFHKTQRKTLTSSSNASQHSRQPSSPSSTVIQDLHQRSLSTNSSDSGSGNVVGNDEVDSIEGEGEKERQRLQERMESLQQRSHNNELEETKLFLGLSFSVPDIDHAISYLKHTDVGSSMGTNASNAASHSHAHAHSHSQPSTMIPFNPTSNPSLQPNPTGPNSISSNSTPTRLEIHHIPGFPRFISFMDPSFISIEITDGVMGINTNSTLTTIESTGHTVGGGMEFNRITKKMSQGKPSTLTPHPHPHPHPHPPPLPSDQRNISSSLSSSFDSSKSTLGPTSSFPLNFHSSPVASSDEDLDFYSTRPDDEDWSETSSPDRKSSRRPTFHSQSDSSSDEDELVGLAAHVAKAIGGGHTNIANIPRLKRNSAK